MRFLPFQGRLVFVRWLATALLFSIAAAAQAQAQAQAPRYTLKVNEQLLGGQYLLSFNRAFFAMVQPDGNFGVFKGSGPSDNRGVVWSTRTGGRPAGPQYFAGVSPIGTLTVVETVAARMTPLWTSDSNSRPQGNYFLALHDDGSLRVHLGTEPANYSGTIWTSVQGTVAAPFAEFSKLSATQGAALSPQQRAALPPALAATLLATPSQASPLPTQSAAQAAAPAKAVEAKTGLDAIKARQAEAAAAAAAAAAATAKAAADAAAAKTKAVDDAAIAAEKGQTPRNFLPIRAALLNDQFLVSPNGAFFALLKQNGDFGVYRGSRPSDNKGLVWSAKVEFDMSQRQIPPEFMVFVAESGHVHVAEKMRTNVNKLWSSPTNNAFPAGGNYFMALHDDGSLRLHVGTEPANRSGTVWSSAQGLVAAPFAEFPRLTVAQADALTPLQLAALPRALAATIPEKVEPYKAVGTTMRSNTPTGALKVHEYLVSPGKTAFAILQRDGNFVVYRGSGPADNKGVVWNTATFGKGTSGPSFYYEVLLGQDGNFGVYLNRATAWITSPTHRPNGNYFVYLHDDGQLAMYYGTGPDNQSGVVWSSSRGMNPSSLAIQSPTLTAAQSAGLSQDQLTAHRAEIAAAAKVIADAKAAVEKAKAAEAAAKAAEAAAKARAAAAEAAAAAAEAETERRAAGPFQTGENVLRTGKFMLPGQYMVSASKKYFAMLQTDGNFCHYEGPNLANRGRELWCSGTNGNPSTHVFMKSNGKFCVRQGLNPQATEQQARDLWCTDVFDTPAERSRQSFGSIMGRIDNFAMIQDDSNFTVFAGTVAHPQGSLWNRITAAEQGRNGWDKFKDAVSGVANVVAAAITDTAGTVASGTVGAAEQVASTARSAANEAKKAADAAADTAKQASRTVATATVSAANTVAKETVSVSNTVATGTVGLANTVANETTRVSVTIGRTVVNGSQIVGHEIVEAGKVVGYAVADLAVEAWAFLKGNCGVIGRRVMSLDAYFQGAQGIAGAIGTYGNDEMKKQVNQANQCFEWVQDGFYCAIPAEMEKIVSQASSMPANLVSLSTKVFNEAKTTECLAAGAATIALGGGGLPMCALGKVMVTDATKAYKCFTAAHSNGTTRALLPAMPPFPDKASCNALGEISLQAAEMIFTSGMSDEAKLLVKAGKGKTALVVADKLRSLYGAMGKASKYQEMVDGLGKMKECQD